MEEDHDKIDYGVTELSDKMMGMKDYATLSSQIIGDYPVLKDVLVSVNKDEAAKAGNQLVLFNTYNFNSSDGNIFLFQKNE